MAKLQQGVEITIRAFLPVGATLEEQHEALTLVKTAKAEGKFDQLLGKGLDLVVKTEMRNRRTAGEVTAPASDAGNGSQNGETTISNSGEQTSTDTDTQDSTSDNSSSTNEDKQDGAAQPAATSGRKAAKAA